MDRVDHTHLERIDLYRQMVRIRQFETAAGRLMAQGALTGSLHLSTGQEAVAVGVAGALRDTDLMSSTHRGHGHCLAKGGDPYRMMAELLGRADGYCRGRGGSMHLADPLKGMLGANAIVGGSFPMAVGAAYAIQARGDDEVSVIFFGEGAVAQGVFHEAMNLAALWCLPVIFVCENNLYAELTPASLHLANDEVASIAGAYGMDGQRCDGNDVDVVRTAAEVAIDRARGGGGPTLLECMTYRWSGHFEGDPARYRPDGELETWKARDPLVVASHRIVQDGGTDEALAAIREEEQGIMAAVVADARAAARPDPEGLCDHVYA